MQNIGSTIEKIQSLKIQGANAVALASLNYLKKISLKQKNAYLKDFLRSAGLLSAARPTEPLNQNFLKFLQNRLKSLKDLPLSRLKSEMNFTAGRLAALNESNQKKIIANSAVLLKKNSIIFTHCHSSLVEKILVAAKEKRIAVYHTETRPMFQGRIMAKNLVKAGINTTMVTDSAAEFLISETSGKNTMMDLAIIGADALLPDGSVINKIGSYGIGLACHESKTPLYVAASLLKMDSDGIIKIEIRPSPEIWPNKPDKLKIINFAFDKVPAKFITGIICEFGIFKPGEIKKIAKINYPWIFEQYEKKLS